ncbi:MAG: pyridoxamine 5'-phosphate oxidase family protein [Planctomycetes bacterium]|nr:pyridoxamine 5'-phosphate oxidase family protein [Planctomycetota bacterium]
MKYLSYLWSRTTCRTYAVLIGLVVLSLPCGCSEPPVATTPKGPVKVGPTLEAVVKTLKAPAYYQGELSWENVEYILHSSSAGRIITNDPEYPYSVPVSFGYCKEKIYIHSSPTGKKIANITDSQKVTFAVDRFNEREGYASINFFGNARIISDAAEKSEALMRFSIAYKGKPDEIEQKVADAKPDPLPPMPLVIIEITPEKVTSRILSLPVAMLRKSQYIMDGKIPAPKNQPPSESEAQIFGGILPVDTVKWLLYSNSIGRINTFGEATAESRSGRDETYPYSVPVNYSYFDGKIYIHSKNNGLKVGDITKNPMVSFTVDRFSATLTHREANLPSGGGMGHGPSAESQRSPALISGDAPGVWLSVNVFGEAKLINDPSQMALLMHKYSTVFNATEVDKIEESLAQIKDAPPESNEMMKRMGQRMVLIEITPTKITSKTSNLPLNLEKLPYTFNQPLLKQAK